MDRAPLVTEAEFLALPESLDKIELVDGELIVGPPPGATHQLVVQNLLVALVTWARGRPESITVGQAPWDVRFGEGRILQPDLFVLFAEVDPNQDGPLDVVPSLCVEVLSGNRVHDRLTKRFVYGRAGVKEYWIVDPAGRFERCTGPELAAATEVRGRIESELLPGFSLELAALGAGFGAS